MIPLVDMHCHLLAGLDDGPRDPAEALEMCRMLLAEGVGMVAATAHQNSTWPEVTPQRIRSAHRELTTQLRREGVGLVALPCAEVMVQPEFESAWNAGECLTIADRGQYALIEMPHGYFVDLREVAAFLMDMGIRPLLAHPERHEEILHEPGVLEELVALGCLVQVSTHSITRPRSGRDLAAIRDWFRRGLVHVLGSDGHSPRRRPPRLAEAFRQVQRWTSSSQADRIGGANGVAILQGIPLQLPEPLAPSRRWLPRLW